jgi:hypothetical protein
MTIQMTGYYEQITPEEYCASAVTRKTWRHVSRPDEVDDEYEDMYFEPDNVFLPIIVRRNGIHYRRVMPDRSYNWKWWRNPAYLTKDGK